MTNTTAPETTTQLETTIDSYLRAYGEPEATTRRHLVEAAWAADGTLADPPFEATGHDAIDATFAAVQAQFPGHTFRRTSAVDEHHGVARYGWDLVAPDGTVAIAGMDVAQFGGDGRLQRVTGFFGDLPPRA
jgi:hypothetical protein